MSISKDDLLKRREEIVTDYNKAVDEIKKGESQIVEMKNNLNALAGALQQTDLFIKQIDDDGDAMPPEKAFALDMATSQEIAMRITEEKEESNGTAHFTLKMDTLSGLDLRLVGASATVYYISGTVSTVTVPAFS